MWKDALVDVVRGVLLRLGKWVFTLFIDVSVKGHEHVPPTNEPLILIANHFSWFDAPLLSMFLPLKTVFLIATESQRMPTVRLFMFVFNGIPIWRGQVDRNAFRAAQDVLNDGGVVGVFPEGGIDPEMAKKVARGEVVVDNHYAHASRHNAQLIRPRSGTALLAVQSEARLLPVALLGTHNIVRNLVDWRRWLRWQRTPVTMVIGPAFGPMTIDPALQGRDKRQRLDELSNDAMLHIARLFPPEQRGVYRDRVMSERMVAK